MLCLLPYDLQNGNEKEVGFYATNNFVPKINQYSLKPAVFHLIYNEIDTYFEKLQNRLSSVPFI